MARLTLTLIAIIVAAGAVTFTLGALWLTVIA